MDAVKTYILELTKACNEYCGFCYSISYSPRGQDVTRRTLGTMDGEQWCAALENIVAAGAEAVDFSGGEPTLHKEFPAILRKAKELGLYTIVSTNGSRLGHEAVRDTFATSADCVALSIHGSGPAVHDTVKGRTGSYADVMRTHDYLLGMTLAKVKVNTVACRQNLADVERIGDAIGIEDSAAVWKVSQAIPREAGRLNKDVLSIADDTFAQLEERLNERYPEAYAQGRLVFREDDTGKALCSPYVIARCDGQLFVPSGTQHKDIGAHILDLAITTRLAAGVELAITVPFDDFVQNLRENHDRSYKK